jgi:hypothetical protein
LSDTPQVGKPFNSFKRLNNILIPISLGPVKTLSWLDKYLYGCLRYAAGDADQCQVKLSSLAESLQLSIDSVHRSIDALTAVGLVERKRGQYGSRIIFKWSPILDGSLRFTPAIRVRNFAESQSPQNCGVLGSESANPRFQTPQTCGSESAELRSVYKEGFTGRREESRGKQRRDTHGSRFSLTELPDAYSAWCVTDLGWDAQRAVQTFARFSDYWLAAAGSKALKVDWFATWRNWCRKDNESAPAAKRSSRDPVAAAMNPCSEYRD